MKKLVMLGAILFLPVSNVYANEVTQHVLQPIQSMVHELNENEAVHVLQPMLIYPLTEKEILDVEETQQNNLVIDNHAITTSGTSWQQPNGFPFWRAFITNDSDQTLTVTYTYSTGQTMRVVVPARNTLTSTTSNATAGTTRADFSSPNGTVNGRITVRVSSLPF